MAWAAEAAALLAACRCTSGGAQEPRQHQGGEERAFCGPDSGNHVKSEAEDRGVAWAVAALGIFMTALVRLEPQAASEQLQLCIA